jgi:hypothetical protein
VNSGQEIPGCATGDVAGYAWSRTQAAHGEEPGTHRPGVTPKASGRFLTAALPQGFGQRMATLDPSYKQQLWRS